MMKKAIMVLLWLMLLSSTVWGAPADQTDVTQQVLEKMSLEDINQVVDKIKAELHENVPGVENLTIQEMAAKGIHINWQQWWKNLMARFFQEIAANVHLSGKLLFLAVLCAILQNLQNSFERSNVSLLTYSICFSFLAVIALTSIYNVLELARQTVAQMVDFMQALLPVLISLLAGVGAVTSAALFSPVMLFLTSMVSLLVKDVVLPLLFLTTVLECVNYLSNTYRLDNLASVFKQGGMVVLSLALVVFIGVVTIQGVSGSVSDGIALRTAKYATATFIPVVGKMFSDTVELVMGASLLLKNTVGILGVLAVLMICVWPLLKILALIVVIKLTGALIQPMGDDRMAKCLDMMGNNLLLIFGAVLTAALMFFLGITMIIGVGNATVMLR
jgi:stage III sporulation protein AE